MTSAKEYFDKAEILYHQGNLKEAIKCYKDALEKDPDYLDALINLSVTLIQCGKTQDALPFIKKALEIDNTNHIVLTNYANILFSLNKTDEALEYYIKALKFCPTSIEIRKNIAHLLMQQGQYEDAVTYLNQLLNEGLTQKDVFLNLTHCLNTLKRHQDALKIILLCYRTFPMDCDVINNLAITFECLGDVDKAENCYRQVVRLQPHNHIYNFNLGLFLKKKGLLEASIDYFKNALLLKGDFQEAMLELGNALKRLKRHHEAIDIYKNLLNLIPNSPIVLNNIGTTYYEMKQYDKALHYLNEALRLNPHFANAYFNRGLVYKDSFEYDKAIEDYKQAIKINKDYPEAHWNLGLLLLSQGDLDNGWRHYEWRKKLSVYKPFERNFAQPEWNGEVLNDKTVLLHDEQGFGDAIQFVRYARLIKDMGARVVIECLEPLTRLFKFAEGVDDVITRGYPLPHFDFHCSLLTLPLRFKTTIDTIPKSIPYIKPNIDFKDKKEPILKIGIAWSGINPPHKSCPLDILFDAFLGLDGIRIFNLQKIMTVDDKRFLLSKDVVDNMNKVKDFLDTAILMADLDIIITIDTAVAHLAGAMGLNVWTILHYDADWRWLLDRDDSPWYPTMRLFRQKRFGDWHSVIKQINHALSEMINPVRS
ncbi:MAG: tetratricopeptide repeat protein [Thermodesulfovibrionales bacterium]|nr:tetratricopeptide repeat protein [Thermodesulfovibrionales bacterium]